MGTLLQRARLWPLPERELVQPATEPHPGRRSAGRRHGRVNVLMVCNLFTLPYRVMRCVDAAGGRVSVLGNAGSNGLRYSRFCHRFSFGEHQFDGSATAKMAAEINRHVEALEIDLVCAGDAPSTRTVVALKGALRARCFPSPDLAQFDSLNNKWEFMHLCRELGIACPPTRLLSDKTAVLEEIGRGTLDLPAIAKPLNLEGGHGVLKLGTTDARQQAEKIWYAPVLLQDFIEGADIGASVYCEAGRIVCFIAHQLKRQKYSTFHAQDIYDAIEKIMARAGCDGVYNFDMRLTPDGRVFFLECNPRFFYKMNLSMMAGMNFAAPGVKPGATVSKMLPHGQRVRMPLAFAADMIKPWTLSIRDLAMMVHLFADPIPYIRENLRIDWEY